jgi:rRNA-processing protein FCF1
VVGALAAADALVNRVLLIMAVGQNQNPDGLADDLLGRIAEKPRRAIVPTCDRAIKAFADDRVAS